MDIATLKRANNPLAVIAPFFLPTSRTHLDIGSGYGTTLRGLDYHTITCIELYPPAVDYLISLGCTVLQGNALDILPTLVANSFDRITLFDFIEHLEREDGEKVLDLVEALNPRELLFFVPIETDELVVSDQYKQFMSDVLSRFPPDYRLLQSHHSRWTTEDFSSRGYDILILRDFHFKGFSAFIAAKYQDQSHFEVARSEVISFFPRVIEPLAFPSPEHLEVGRNLYIGKNGRIECVTDYHGYKYSPKLTIGNNVSMEPFVHIGCANKITIGDDVMISGRVTIMDHDHGFSDPLTPAKDQPLSVGYVSIGRGAWIGEGAYIGKNTTIGINSIVGANSVVTHHLPDYSVAGGAPAHILKRYNFHTNSWETPPEHRAYPLTSIIIPVHRGLDLTDLCLDSISKHTPIPHEIILVDNDSDLSEFLQSWDRGTPKTLITNDTNLGYPAALNQGLRAAAGDYIVFINNDVVVGPYWLERLLDTFIYNPDVGAVGPVTNFASGLQKVSATYESLASMQDYALERVRKFDGVSRQVPRLVGFCLCVSREVVDRIGALDERFGIGNYEDDDYSIRIQLSGYTLRIALDSYVHHQGHATFAQTGNLKELLDTNWRIFREKWGISHEEHIYSISEVDKSVPLYIPLDKESSSTGENGDK